VEHVVDHATRVDRHRGIRETARFVGPEGDRVFTCLHEPLDPVRGAVLVCPSLHAEMASNYRREVLLSRRLAERGFAAMRFHYRGSGHSDRDSGFESIDTMREDAGAALRWLGEWAPAASVGVVGTRLGSAAAVAAVAAEPAPIVLWEPVIDGARYVRETLRKQAFRDIAIGRRPAGSASDVRSELRERGEVDVLGYPISLPLHDAIALLRLDRLLDAATPRPLLLLEIGTRAGVRPEYARVVERLNASGWTARAEVAEGSEAWWFAGEGWENEEEQPLSRALLDSTSSWFATHLDPEAAA